MNHQNLVNIKNVRTINYDSFQLLYDNYSENLYFYALKFIEDEAARDIVHDVFVKLWTKRDEIEIKSSVNSYLYTMVKNGCLALLEKRLVRKRYNEEKAIKLQIEEVKYYQLRGGIKSLIEEEHEKMLSRAMAKLPPRCSEIFLLCRQENMKYKEVAASLNISIKTVEKQMTLAMRILRSELKDYLPLALFILSKWHE